MKEMSEPTPPPYMFTSDLLPDMGPTEDEDVEPPKTAPRWGVSWFRAERPAGMLELAGRLAAGSGVK